MGCGRARSQGGRSAPSAASGPAAASGLGGSFQLEQPIVVATL